MGCRPRAGDKWHLDEVMSKIKGKTYYHQYNDSAFKPAECGFQVIFSYEKCLFFTFNVERRLTPYRRSVLR